MGAFAVVLAGLRAVGASEAQAASGLPAVSLGMGATSVALSVRALQRWRSDPPPGGLPEVAL